jgi:L-asparaginase II
VATTALSTVARRSSAGRATSSARTAPPVLVRQIRNGIVESEHRGHVVEVDVTGRTIRGIGDPNHMVTLRSTVKPFGLVALLEAGGVAAFDLSSAEIALMASSHSGEDLHVRTLQGVYRRAGVSQTLLACGTEGMPLDALTAARLARDGERPSPIRHMCSGQHSVFILLSRLNDWPLETYWQADHPAHVAYRSAVARAYGVKPDAMKTAIDGCGVLTYAFPLREVARAYALLAQPDTAPTGDARHALAPHLMTIRDAMLAHPEMVAGHRDRLDTSVMKALPGRVVSKGGMEALRGVAILPGPRASGAIAGPTGLALKVEDGDGYERGTWAATVEALRQVGVLDGPSLRAVARYHRPVSLDPHGRAVAEAVPDFDLVPIGELFP